MYMCYIFYIIYVSIYVIDGAKIRRIHYKKTILLGYRHFRPFLFSFMELFSVFFSF